MLGDVNLGVGMEQCGMGMTEADISLGVMQVPLLSILIKVIYLADDDVTAVRDRCKYFGT